MKCYKFTLDDLKPFNITALDDALRPTGVELVADMRAADFFILPVPLRDTTMPPSLLHEIINYFKIDERRLAIFDCSDFEADYGQTNPNCMFIRCNGSKGWMKQKMPRTIVWPWPVEDFSECIPVPNGGFKYDVSAHMWVTSSNVRRHSCDSVVATFGSRADTALYSDFCGYIYYEPEGIRRRKEFRRSMRESRLSLAPSSIHSVFPYRFFEAMSAARVPVLLCSHYWLPWPGQIDWDACVIRLDVQDAKNAGPLIKDWLSKHSDAEIIEMGKRGRKYWEDWLDSRKWNDLFAIAIEESLRAEGLLR